MRSAVSALTTCVGPLSLSLFVTQVDSDNWVGGFYMEVYVDGIWDPEEGSHTHTHIAMPRTSQCVCVHSLRTLSMPHSLTPLLLCHCLCVCVLVLSGWDVDKTITMDFHTPDIEFPKHACQVRSSSIAAASRSAPLTRPPSLPPSHVYTAAPRSLACVCSVHRMCVLSATRRRPLR